MMVRVHLCPRPIYGDLVYGLHAEEKTAEALGSNPNITFSHFLSVAILGRVTAECYVVTAGSNPASPRFNFRV